MHKRQDDILITSKEGGAPMTFGEKLQVLRKKQGWTQEELAAKIAVSRQALSKWELGAAIPDTENVLQISKLFGVSTDYLLNDEYDSDNDIPAVQTKSEALTKRYSGMMYAIIGSIVSAISAAAVLIMAILASTSSATISNPSAEADGLATVKTGLPAFLELNNIGWLFALCVILFFVGIFIVAFPKLQSRRKNS